MVMFFSFDHIFSVLTIFKFINQEKVSISRFFSRLLPNAKLKNIMYYSYDVKNYGKQVLNFSLFHKHEYTHGIFWSAILVSIFKLQVYLTFPLFLKTWLTESILIFREELFQVLLFYWLVTFNLKSFFQWKQRPSQEWCCVHS